jgi:hypothetical protein
MLAVISAMTNLLYAFKGNHRVPGEKFLLPGTLKIQILFHAALALPKRPALFRASVVPV